MVGRWQISAERWILGASMFVQRYFLPDSGQIPVSEVNSLAKAAGFEVRDSVALLSYRL